MYLILDTEANGPARFRNAPAAYVWKWPRLVQVAWLIADANGRELSDHSFIVRPDGFEITKRLARDRGITTETALRGGEEIGEVLAALARDAGKVEAIVGHNIHYDRRVIEAELHRLRTPASPFTGKKLYCTMRSSTSLCRLPGPFGYKWPKLQELHRALFNSDLIAAHDAKSDVRACAECFFELKRRGVVADYTLFDDVERLARRNVWFDKSWFVDGVRAQFENRGISERQRSALTRIRDMLARRATGHAEPGPR